MKRDTYIDIVRGIAALSVISIHTACKSGASYTPAWLLSLTLLLDVPVFFMVSGWSCCFRPGRLGKSVQSLFGMWCKWVFFVVLLAAACRLTGLDGVRSVKELYESLFFRASFRDLPVLNESLWFLPVYARVLLFNQLALFLMQLAVRNDRPKLIQSAGLYFGLLIFLYFASNAKFDLLPIGDIQDYYYAAIWMFGLMVGLLDMRIRSWKVFAALVLFCCAGFFLARRWMQTPQLLQDVKFPPRLPYAFASGISFCVILFLRGRVKATGYISRWLAHVGQNAFFYFVGQGVMSSLLSLFLPYFNWQAWFAQWLVFLIINLLGTTLIAETSAWLYSLFFGLWQRFRLVFRLNAKGV